LSDRAGQSNDRERVLDATDIVRLVGEHVALKARGREYVCLCPFHDDHKPSMYVVPHKQIYHCFSCNAGGNAIDFVMNFHKMDFIEALRHLADRSGVTLTPRRSDHGGASGGAKHSAGDESGRTPAAAQRDANAYAQSFFRSILRHPEHGAEARAMIARRGISEEMVEAFGVGAAPDRWDGLLLTIRAKGLDENVFARAGLLKTRENDGGRYDAFRHRLIFPIHDQVGRVVAFGGRKLREEDEPKYLNSPESEAFDKSRTLYGLHQAFREIQKERVAVVTEGYTDVIACHQAGVRNVVATMGTALTREHARILGRLCDTVVLVFDADVAGQKAADRALEVFFASPVDVRIAVLPGGKDPDELLKQEGGADRFRACVAGATDALDYRFARLRERLAGVGLSARARIIEEDLARLAEIGLHELSPIRKRLVIRRIAGVAGVNEQEVIASAPRARPRRADADAPPPRPRREHTRAEQALGALLCAPGLWDVISPDEHDILREHAYAASPADAVTRAAEAVREQGREPTLSEVLGALDESDARQAAVAMAAAVETITDNDPERIERFLRDCLRVLARERARDAGASNTGAQTDDFASRIAAQRKLRETYGDAARAIPGVAAPTTGPSG